MASERKRRPRAPKATAATPPAPEISAGCRALVAGEHLFLGRTHRDRHRWMETTHPVAGTVVICGVCGKLRQGETMPESWEAIVR